MMQLLFSNCELSNCLWVASQLHGRTGRPVVAVHGARGNFNHRWGWFIRSTIMLNTIMLNKGVGGWA